MKGVPLVRASAFIPFVAFFQQLGARVESLLERAKLPAAILVRPEALIPVHQACSFVDEASGREGIGNIGFIVGERLCVDALGAYGRLVARSPTLREALHTAARLNPHFSSAGRLWLDGDVDRVWFRFGQDRRIERGWQQAEQLTVMFMLQILRLTSVGASCAVDVQMRAREAPGRGDVEWLGNARIRFGHTATGIAIPRRWLSERIRVPASAVAARADVERRLTSSGPVTDFPGALRQTIATLLLGGYPNVRQTAEAIGMSVRTLQRRLSDVGLSYSRLVEQERFQAAVRLLADPAVKVTDVAIELGYADLANFSHAFHRWTGASPSEYRLAATG